MVSGGTRGFSTLTRKNGIKGRVGPAEFSEAAGPSCQVGDRDGMQGEQERVRGDEEYLVCGDNGGKGEEEGDGQNDRKNSVEVVLGAGVEGETGEAEEVMELEASAPMKRRSKRKNVVAAVQAGKQVSKLAAERKEVSDSSDAESWFSDTSEISVSQTSSKEPRYPVESFRTLYSRLKV
ncbi:hypothetical protein CHARACLAT_024127 [Characodon lateralis]|uniref:Uncharacterized protein n=1 Tax=Characodon lateralis TaxID=208331 RepID=A0ABU7E790_9TELE|nr:hypothetical protein [Characodon lateralis]